MPLPDRTPTLKQRRDEFAKAQRRALADPLVAAMWAECRVVCGSREFRLISARDLRHALVAALRRQAAIMRRDHADPILIAEYERLAGEVER